MTDRRNPGSGAGEETRYGVGIAVLSLVVIGLVAVLILGSPASSGPQDPGWLPTVNAVLNGTSGLLLCLGYAFIRQRRIDAHRACMMLATVVSALFLVTYVVHHAQVGSVRFEGPGWLRTLYLAVLLPHVVLSAALVPMALTTLSFAWRGNFARHRRVARWTFPVWLFVSVSGVVVYWMLYHLGR